MLERVRDLLSGVPEADYFENKKAEGWKILAIEWERITDAAAGELAWGQEVPYGTQIAEDHIHLVDNPAETEALTAMIELLLADKSMSQVARGLNERGHRMRNGTPWHSVAVFELLPRIVEVAPKIFPTQDWSARRRHLFSHGL
jgi:hypothetical protein